MIFLTIILRNITPRYYACQFILGNATLKKHPDQILLTF